MNKTIKEIPILGKHYSLESYKLSLFMIKTAPENVIACKELLFNCHIKLELTPLHLRVVIKFARKTLIMKKEDTLLACLI